MEKTGTKTFRQARAVQYDEYSLDELEARLVRLQQMLDADIAQRQRLNRINNQLTKKTDLTEEEITKGLSALLVGGTGVSKREIDQLQALIDELKLL